MKKKIAYSSLFLIGALVNYMFLFFIYGDIKLRELEFGGEPLPHSSFAYVEKRIVWNNKKFLKRLYLKNKEREILPFIEKQISERSLPNDLKYIPYVESSLNGNAVSGNDTVGLWQVQEKVGKDFGMKITNDFDERYDEKISTSVALEQLTVLYDLYGSWILASVAYSFGEDVISSGDGSAFDRIKTPEAREYILNMSSYKYGR